MIIAVFKLVEKKLFKEKRNLRLVVMCSQSKLEEILKTLGDIGAKVKEVNVDKSEDGVKQVDIRLSITGSSRTDIMVELAGKLSDYDISSIKML